MAGGRPTKCTPEVIAQFADYMGAGLYFEDACDLCHITRSTGYHWLDEGEAALEEAGGDIDAIDDDNRRMWATFSDTVRARSAQAIARNLAIIQQAAGAKVEGDWRAAEAFLKMRRPDTWGMRKQKHELSGPGGGAVEVQHGVDPESIAEALEQLLARTGAGAGAGTDELGSGPADDSAVHR